MLCKVRPWEENDVELSYWESRSKTRKGGGEPNSSQFKTTKDVWEALPRATKAGEGRVAPRPS